MNKIEWKQWYTLHRPIVAFLGKFPELEVIRHNGLWRNSISGKEHGEDCNTIGFRARTLYYDTVMPAIYKMQERGWSISVHAVNHLYVEVNMYENASFKHDSALIIS